MAGEGEVIACHILEDWHDNINAANESNKLIVINFTASWSPACMFTAPIFEDKAKRFTNVVFLEIDVDELQSLAKDFEVETMPTFVFMNEGQIVDRVVGTNEVKIHRKLVEHGGIDTYS